MSNQVSLLNYTLQIADNALILGHRLSEWCGRGPILEQDIALSNTALDYLGQARSLYQYAAELYNALPAEEQEGLFSSPMLQQAYEQKGKLEEDDVAYLRDAWDFRNSLLTEQPNGDWAMTIARSFFADVFNYHFYTALQQSSDSALAAVAEKSVKEATYHMKWSSEWIIRLGDGTEESHARMQQAVDERWMYTGELTIPSEADKAMQAAGIGVDLEAVRQQWAQRVAEVMAEATLQLPKAGWMQQGGKDGRHSEHLGYILAEMQYLQRAYPGMEW